MTRVSRGTLGVERAGQARLKPRAVKDVVESAYAIIGAADPDFYQLRDCRDLMRRLIRGDPDIHGRRLLTDAARMDARYIIRLINTRLRHEDFTQRQGAMLHASPRRVYEALEAGKEIVVRDDPFLSVNRHVTLPCGNCRRRHDDAMCPNSVGD